MRGTSFCIFCSSIKLKAFHIKDANTIKRNYPSLRWRRFWKTLPRRIDSQLSANFYSRPTHPLAKLSTFARCQTRAAATAQCPTFSFAVGQMRRGVGGWVRAVCCGALVSICAAHTHHTDACGTRAYATDGAAALGKLPASLVRGVACCLLLKSLPPSPQQHHDDMTMSPLNYSGLPLAKHKCTALGKLLTR